LNNILILTGRVKSKTFHQDSFSKSGNAHCPWPWRTNRNAYQIKFIW